jgi:hypothetical protein
MAGNPIKPLLPDIQICSRHIGKERSRGCANFGVWEMLSQCISERAGQGQRPENIFPAGQRPIGIPINFTP